MVTHRKQDVLHHLLPHQQVDDAHDVRNRQQPGGVVHHVQQEAAHNIAVRPAGVWECMRVGVRADCGRKAMAAGVQRPHAVRA